jgi:hypothetical protein
MLLHGFGIRLARARHRREQFAAAHRGSYAVILRGPVTV